MLDLLFDAIGRLYFHGGPLIFVLTLVLFVVALVALERAMNLYWNRKPLAQEVLCRWDRVCHGRRRHLHGVREIWLKDYQARLSRGLRWLRVAMLISPMLGLLGTVTGMIQVFDVLAQFGTSNPRLMADGIARATIPSLCGMFTALVSIYLYSRLQCRIQLACHTLDEQMIYQRSTEESNPCD